MIIRVKLRKDTESIGLTPREFEILCTSLGQVPLSILDKKGISDKEATALYKRLLKIKELNNVK